MHILFHRRAGAALLLCVCLLVSLCGCKARTGSPSSSSSGSSSSSSSSSRSESSSSGASSPVLPDDKEKPVPPESASSVTPEDENSKPASSEPAAAAGSADLGGIGALPGEAVTWGPGTQFDDKNRPTACIGLQAQYEKYGSLFLGAPGQNGEKTVYLTFDQGYENGCTAHILDTLKEKGAPATFFLTGHYVESAPELIERMAAEGHTLGNHSNRHLDATEVPLAEMRTDLRELRDMVRERFDTDCTLYRFPEGKFSEQTLALVQAEGCRPVFWSFAYADWDPDNQPAEDEALERLVSRLHDGAIYLLHSVSSTNAAILGRFIDAARAEGYVFSSLA